MAETPDFLRLVLGDRPGKLAVAFGRRPYFDDKGKYRFRDWHDKTMFAWPGELPAFLAAVQQEMSSGDPVDIYICPYIRHAGARTRRKGDALPPMLCHVDLDNAPADKAIFDTLNPLQVNSGQPGHVHAYVPLSRPVSLGEHRTLQEALRDRLGGDDKIADNDLLRWPGSLNHKPATAPNTGEPATITIAPGEPTVWDPDELAAMLGVDLETVGSTGASATVAASEPVDLAALPEWLRQRFTDANGAEDRSDAFHGLVGACKDAGLTQGQTVTVMGTWRPGVDKYGPRLADEVARCWPKLADARTFGRRTAAAEGGAASDDRPELLIWTPAQMAEWIREHLGTGPLAGMFARDNDIVFTPREGEEGYIEPRDDRDHDGPAQIRIFTTGMITARIQWTYTCVKLVKDENGKWVKIPAMFPSAAAGVAVNAPDLIPNLRRLRGVTHTPLVRADGTILTAPGYDKATKLLHLPEPGLDVPAVPDRPTEEDVERAIGLLNEMVAGFKFVTDHHRANYYGYLLTPILRELTPPPYKLGALTAPQPGSGKTLLATIARIVHGGVFRGEMPEDEAELRKQVTAILDQTTGPVVTIDNVTGILSSSTLAALLTSARWDDRRLGATEMLSRANDRVWMITGNNVAIGGDLPRRTIPIVIDPGVPHPERRTGFAIPDLEEWARRRRGELLWALLTLVRAWVIAGRPLGDAAGSDGYARWIRTVRGILSNAHVAGVFDHDETRLDVGVGDDEWADFLTDIHKVLGGKEWTVKELLAKFDTTDSGLNQAKPLSIDSLPSQLADKVEKAQSVKVVARPLGVWLRNREGRWAGSHTVRLAGRDDSNTSRWKIETYAPTHQDHPEPGTSGSKSPSARDTFPGELSQNGHGSGENVSSARRIASGGSGVPDDLEAGLPTCTRCGKPNPDHPRLCDSCVADLSRKASS